MQAWDEERLPYLGRQRAFLREAVEEGVPVLGICLGGQLLARALGAEVRPAERLEAGWLEIEATPEAAGDALLAHLRAPVGVYQWHTDVFDLPDGAVRLARSEQSENQAFRYGERAWGLQFHPEVDAAALRGLDAELRGRAGAGGDRSRRAGGRDRGRLARVHRPLFGAFCSVCVAPRLTVSCGGRARATSAPGLQAFGRRLSTPKRRESAGSATKSDESDDETGDVKPLP